MLNAFAYTEYRFLITFGSTMLQICTTFLANKMIATIARPTEADCQGANFGNTGDTFVPKVDPQCMLVNDRDHYETLLAGKQLSGLFQISILNE